LLSRGELFDSLVGDLHGVPDLLVDRAGWTVLDGEVGAGEVLGGGVLIATRTGDSSLPKNKFDIFICIFIFQLSYKLKIFLKKLTILEASSPSFQEHV